jgi:hypothetical protein
MYASDTATSTGRPLTSLAGCASRVLPQIIGRLIRDYLAAGWTPIGQQAGSMCRFPVLANTARLLYWEDYYP